MPALSEWRSRPQLVSHTTPGSTLVWTCSTIRVSCRWTNTQMNPILQKKPRIRWLILLGPWPHGSPRRLPLGSLMQTTSLNGRIVSLGKCVARPLMLTPRSRQSRYPAKARRRTSQDHRPQCDRRKFAIV